jgi:hypothetical protein
LSIGRGRASLGATLFFALLAATLTVAVLVVRARSPDLVLEVTSLTCSFRPGADEGLDQARATFFVREADPHAVVAIVDPAENVVRTLDEDVALAVEEEASYAWDGRTDQGRRAPPGRYRLSVGLPAAERTMIWPERVILGSARVLPDRCEPALLEGDS